MRGKSKQSDTSIVVMKRANKEGELSAESVERRDGAKGNSAHQSTDRTQSRITVTQAGVGYGGRRDLPSLPEVGAVCLNGHARICAGGAGQPVSLPRLPVAHWDRRLSCRLLRTDEEEGGLTVPCLAPHAPRSRRQESRRSQRGTYGAPNWKEYKFASRSTKRRRTVCPSSALRSSFSSQRTIRSSSSP